ncbi:hypothetical protein CMV_005960 [Castanea mollissima]|uniref:Uncharacterized protein n=1 Tax=Castanea mollissima TaxID=60419 RepID=A0A8J4RPI6_9ROSI|nr:hypothetical protein CMV_005960 [Castanea mollissima]
MREQGEGGADAATPSGPSSRRLQRAACFTASVELVQLQEPREKEVQRITIPDFEFVRLVKMMVMLAAGQVQRCCCCCVHPENL